VSGTHTPCTVGGPSPTNPAAAGSRPDPGDAATVPARGACPIRTPTVASSVSARCATTEISCIRPATRSRWSTAGIAATSIPSGRTGIRSVRRRRNRRRASNQSEVVRRPDRGRRRGRRCQLLPRDRRPPTRRRSRLPLSTPRLDGHGLDPSATPRSPATTPRSPPRRQPPSAAGSRPDRIACH
jgi:hypothetical protein